MSIRCETITLGVSRVAKVFLLILMDIELEAFIWFFIDSDKHELLVTDNLSSEFQIQIVSHKEHEVRYHNDEKWDSLTNVNPDSEYSIVALSDQSKNLKE